MITVKTVSLSEQITFISQELRRKDIEYAPKVRRGHIPRDVAQYKLGCMQAVLDTLLALERERVR